MDSWSIPFKHFLEENFDLDFDETKVALEEDFLSERLTQFLFSERGAVFMKKFVFQGEIVCGQAASRVLVSEEEVFLSSFCLCTHIIYTLHVALISLFSRLADFV